MTYWFRTFHNASHRDEVFGRLRGLDLQRPARWGRLTAPRMLAHLCDQMRMSLRDRPCAPIPGPARYPFFRELFLYVLPWPKGKITGPPEAFETDPAGWSQDLATLEELVEHFIALGPERVWPDHPHFGRMTRRAWGCFCYRHFDHHLRQFGA